MINPIEFYAECGKRAAIARNQRDESRAQFEANHFRRARALENDTDRKAANSAYQTAYQAARTLPL